MKYLISVACSFLILISCTSSVDKKEAIQFPLNISGIYQDLIKSARIPMSGGPIKVFESGHLLVFQISNSKDVFMLDGNDGKFQKIALNPPDTIGRMVYRYDPVSFVFPYNSGFVYLKNGSEMNSLGKFGIKNDRLKINGINLSNPVKILHLSEDILISYWAGGTIDNSTSPGGVFITDISKNTTNLVVSKSENWAEITSSGDKIFVLEKYSPIITIYDFKGRKIQTIEMTKPKFLKYEKRVRPPGYLQMPAEKKVSYLEDYCLDFFQKGDSTYFLHQVFSAKGNAFNKDYILSIFSNGKLKEIKLEFEAMNFSSTGEIFFIYETDSGQFLTKKPVSKLY